MNAILLAVALLAALPVTKTETPLPASKSILTHITGADINGLRQHGCGDGPAAAFVNVKCPPWNAKGDGVTDDHAAIMAAIAAVSANGSDPYSGGSRSVAAPVVYFPPGKYVVGQTINLKKTVHLYGGGAGNGAPAVILQFPADTDGIIVNRHNTLGRTTLSNPDATTYGDGSIIEGMRLQGAGKAVGTTGHGIWMRARATVRSCSIYNFRENGINIAAASDANEAPLGNANSWRVDHVRLAYNGGHGLYIIGADANAGYADSVDASSNGGWGILDSSFLGNTFVAAHAAGNTLGPYKTTNANAHSVFLGCYSEGGQPPSDFYWRSIGIGGIQGAGFTGNFISGENGFVRTTQLRTVTQRADTGASVTVEVNGNPPGGDILGIGRTDIGSGPLWRLKWHGDAGDLRFDYGNSDAKVAFRLTGPTTAFTGGRSGAVPFAFVSERLFVGTGNTGPRQITASASAPSSGTWAKGDVILNTNAAAGGKVGWVCTTGGTAGVDAVFKPFGAIDP